MRRVSSCEILSPTAVPPDRRVVPASACHRATREIRIREAAEQRGHIPILAMTADAMPGDRERCIAAGMDDYLAKPIRGQDLDTVLERRLPGEATPGSLDESRLEQLRSLFPGGELSIVVHELVSTCATSSGASPLPPAPAIMRPFGRPAPR